MFSEMISISEPSMEVFEDLTSIISCGAYGGVLV